MNTQRFDSLVLASGNAHKFLEMTPLQAFFKMKLQSDLGVASVPEVGSTFIENALIKAKHCAAQTGCPSLADDSGLMVAGLEGAPGLYSARYAGVGASDLDNINKLLAEMQSCQGEQRAAMFYCVLVLLTHAEDPAPLCVEGRWHGHIALQPCGEQGFGYDPVFICNQHGVSAASLDVDAKNAVSHRGLALRALIKRLREACIIKEVEEVKAAKES